MLIPLSDMASCFCVRVLRALAISSDLEEFLSLLASTGREPYSIEVTFCNIIEYFSGFTPFPKCCPGEFAGIDGGLCVGLWFYSANVERSSHSNPRAFPVFCLSRRAEQPVNAAILRRSAKNNNFHLFFMFHFSQSFHNDVRTALPPSDSQQSEINNDEKEKCKSKQRSVGKHERWKYGYVMCRCSLPLPRGGEVNMPCQTDEPTMKMPVRIADGFRDDRKQFTRE